MKRFLDDFFVNFLQNKDNFVISADVGYFPNARKMHNYIDIGNCESTAGSLIDGLLSAGKNVCLYDICGYVFRNSYSSFIDMQSRYKKNRGVLTVFGWGSGFAYDGCLHGHYPFDDIILAKLFGLKVYEPLTPKSMYFSYFMKNGYIRLLNLDEYHMNASDLNICNGEFYLYADGWMYCEINKFLKELPPDKSKKFTLLEMMNPDNIEESGGIYFSDQYYCEIIRPNNPQIQFSCPEIHDIYTSKDDFVQKIIRKPILEACSEI